ncbi:protein of unknown function [Cnuella takakiae]|uniref:DUF4835 domain-containing protein n=1 Tax=Cnuella takakiae TaxID=1302690 RepID=A0A1M5C4C7_9BACT|nr:DUF4835 family protein [Cnuella takakiae]OLY93625.1 DUF4835 domain-containing protein [Cnuella takakiae]SHF49589.1 protein of unknown function [Cnuella takakiae]
MKRILAFLLFVLLCREGHAQELQARLTVVATQISSNVDRKVFQTLQTSLINFLNNRKWTADTYLTQERIKCNFLLNIEQALGDNTYKASLTVQVARPVFNSAYESPLINWQDNDVVFRYVEFQPVEFNENRVQGSDPLVANLTAVMAYYVNLVLGMDADSFAPSAGEPYYRRAQNIVNNAPEGRDIVGWKTFDGIRNRFRLVDNLTDNRFNAIHEALYDYYRQGLDQFHENDENARKGILNGLNSLNRLNQEIPNSMAIQFFFGGKSNELVRIFSKATPSLKAQARELLARLDAPNTNAYNELK